jgi:hypothetical protein
VGIVKAVHEFEAERDEEGNEQHKERHIGGDRRASRVQVSVKTVRDVKQTAGENAGEQDHGQRIETLVELGPMCRLERSG